MTQTIIGLTGGIGSGKSTIASLFAKLNVDYIDVDDVAREVVKPGTELLGLIHDRYGPSMLNDDHSLNRATLRHIIFNDLNEKKWLESITHPIIRSTTMEKLHKSTSKYCLLVHPLLFETRQNEICSDVISISVPQTLQIERVCKRDYSTKEDALKIIQTQISNQERIQKAKYVIENTGNMNELGDKVYAVHQQILNNMNE
ncbi:dephospho-CoA kinase [Marinomonas sp. 2405UD68-3]|uniref:dephospho-CoA kinase n=1 Tax=Marinomonas sp. 2405UD68-3 TaxID=3391835 RepID=UPI0039C9F035